MLQRAREPQSTPVFGEEILIEVARLIKWTVAGRDLPPNRVPIHSLRAGGATRLYLAGVGLEYIRRFGRWQSSTSAIYLRFGDKTARNLASCPMRIEGSATQLKLCTGGAHRAVFEKGGGDWMEKMPAGMKKETGCVGKPTTSGMENARGEMDERTIPP